MRLLVKFENFILFAFQVILIFVWSADQLGKTNTCFYSAV